MIAKLRHIDFNQQPVKIEVYSVTQEQPHYHQDNVLEILLCLDGSVDIRSYFMKFRKDSGDITSFDYMDIHTAKSHGQNLLVSYYFDLAHPAFGKISERFHFFDCDKTDSTSFAKLKELRQLLLIILAINTMPDDLMDHREKQIKQESVACKIIKLMEDSFISIGVDLDFSEYPDALKERFGQLLLYIDNHQQERLTIKQLGDVIHVNPDYLSQLFRQIITGGFRQYMYMMKLYWAHFTLLTNDSVNLFD
ncbi:MAG: hypothetical protein HUJ79_07415, partial [Firmicutes bacterium]|nr:hypothetical protein [Bacillota bacterium]